MENLKKRGKHRIRAENEIIRRREQETRYNELWSGNAKYFDHWNKACSKFQEWTSPRYYSENIKLLSDIKNKKDKEEQLTKRREKLRKLFQDERRSYEIEIIVHKNKYIVDKPRRDNLQVSTNVLREINDNIKTEEENKRRREAELKLYQQWRRNNPIVRQYEAKYNCRDLKLSWLDQQIEKKMAIEREEEENRRILKEQEEKLKEEREKEEYMKKQLHQKREQLKTDLEKQILELREKQKISDDLRSKEDAEMKQQTLLAELEEKYKSEEKRRLEQECVLFNIRQHKRKLQQKTKDIQEDLEHDRRLISRLRDLELNDIIQDEMKRNEIQEGIKEFLDILHQQQKLEILRKKRMEFLFDSEAKALYDMQEALWKQEEMNRKKLIKEVMDSVKKQIQDNLERNKNYQIEVLKEREEITEKIEQYHQELNKLKEEEEKKKQGARFARQEEIKVKAAKEKSVDTVRMKELDKELELIHKEEERLQKEILRIQQRQGPIRPPRSRLFL